jgi:hypothetical protein
MIPACEVVICDMVSEMAHSRLEGLTIDTTTTALRADRRFRPMIEDVVKQPWYL